VPVPCRLPIYASWGGGSMETGGKVESQQWRSRGGWEQGGMSAHQRPWLGVPQKYANKLRKVCVLRMNFK